MNGGVSSSKVTSQQKSICQCWSLIVSGRPRMKTRDIYLVGVIQTVLMSQWETSLATYPVAKPAGPHLCLTWSLDKQSPKRSEREPEPVYSLQPCSQPALCVSPLCIQSGPDPFPAGLEYKKPAQPLPSTLFLQWAEPCSQPNSHLSVTLLHPKCIPPGFKILTIDAGYYDYSETYYCTLGLSNWTSWLLMQGLIKPNLTW